jgi:hypothetical protein
MGRKDVKLNVRRPRERHLKSAIIERICHFLKIFEFVIAILGRNCEGLAHPAPRTVASNSKFAGFDFRHASLVEMDGRRNNLPIYQFEEDIDGSQIAVLGDIFIRSSRSVYACSIIVCRRSA